MAILIPFPLPNKGYALNSKVRINLDAVVSEMNKLEDRLMTWGFYESAAINLIVNGGFEDWSAGTTFTNPVDNAAIADSWNIGILNLLGSTISRSADEYGETYSLKIETQPATGGESRTYAYQYISLTSFYAGKIMSFSAYVKSSDASTWRIGLYDGVTTTYSNYHSGSGNWEKLTVTKTCDALATQLAVTCGLQEFYTIASQPTLTAYYDNLMLTESATAEEYVPTSTIFMLLQQPQTVSGVKTFSNQPVFSAGISSAGGTFTDKVNFEESITCWKDLFLRGALYSQAAENRIDNITSLGTTTLQGPVHIAFGGKSLTIGADNLDATRTDATIKYGRIASPHYTNSEEPLTLITGGSTSTASTVTIGGGSNLLNAAKQIELYTAADTTTTSGTLAMQIDSIGAITQPLQPSFLAYNSADDVNATGDGTVATVDFDTEVFDLNADFASDTFTAPITGKYQLNTVVRIENSTAEHLNCYVAIVTGNRTYRTDIENLNAWAFRSFPLSVLADMDANDTAIVQIAITGNDAADVEISGASVLVTCFSGSLIN